MESVDHELALGKIISHFIWLKIKRILVNIGGYDGIYTTAVVSHYLSTHLYQLAKTRFTPVVPPLTLDYAAKKTHACNFGLYFFHLLVDFLYMSNVLIR